MISVNRVIPITDLVAKYQAGQRRLLVIDYDGVLVPYESHRGLTIPSRETRELIRELTSDKKNTVMLVSGRDVEHLEKYWLKDNMIVVAENGSLYHEPGGGWKTLFDNDSSWLEKIEPSMNSLAFQFEGTFVEKKQTSITWHYRTAKRRIEYTELRQVVTAVNALMKLYPFAMQHGEGYIELGAPGIDAGSFMARWIAGQNFDFTICIGQVRLDESLFGLFTQEAFLIRVSTGGFTHANYALQGQEQVLPLLSKLV